MKHIAMKKLVLRTEVVRSMSAGDLRVVQGGAIDPTRRICDTAGPACLSAGHTCAFTCAIGG